MYAHTKQLNTSFEESILAVKRALENQGFGVLSEINIKETMKNKLNVDFDDYVILGACNPPLALKALQTEKEIGLFLPCNLIVYRKKGKVFVSTILPTVAMEMIGNDKLNSIFTKVEAKLIEVIETL